MRSLVGSITALATGKNDTAPVTYAPSGRFNLPSVFSGRGDNETYMRTMATAGTIFQIVSLLATATAGPQWRLYRKPTKDGRVRYTTGDRGTDQRVEVLQHQALNVWNRPNAFSTGSLFREAGQQHMELTGEQWWIVTRDSRATFPTGLWLVRPDRMEPIPSAEKYLAGYVYTGPSGEKVPLGVEDVILTKFPNPLDPYRGLGPVQSVLVDLDAMRYGAEWNRNFFMNSAQPGGIVTVPGNLSDEEFDQFTTRWRESHQGVSRAHRVAILEGGATWVPTQMTIKDMDFSNLREVSRDVLREAWGIHKSMLGNSEDVNKSNAQTAEEVFGRWKIIPRLDRIRDTLNNAFLPMFGSTGDGVEFDYINPLPDDREADNAELAAKSTAAAALVQAGFDPEMVCEVVGLPPMKMAEIAPPPAPPAQQPDPAEADNEDDTTTDGGNSDGTDPVKKERQVVNLWRPKAAAAEDHDPSAVDLADVDAQWQEATDQLAAAYADQISPDQRQQLLQQIETLIAAGTISALGTLVLEYEAAKALLKMFMLSFGTKAAQQASNEAAKQGVKGVAAVAPSSAQLEPIAETTAALMAQELSISAGREAARLAGTPALPAPGTEAAQQFAQQVAAQVGTFLENLSPAGALSTAQNAARIGTFTAGPRCELVAAEVNDRNRCQPCSNIDGESFGYTDDPTAVARAIAAYPTSGYAHCEGGERCRGTLIARYPKPQAPPQANAGDITTMLHRLVALLDAPQPAHINGHELHEREVSA